MNYKLFMHLMIIPKRWDKCKTVLLGFLKNQTRSRLAGSEALMNSLFSWLRKEQWYILSSGKSISHMILGSSLQKTLGQGFCESRWFAVFQWQCWISWIKTSTESNTDTNETVMLFSKPDWFGALERGSGPESIQEKHWILIGRCRIYSVETKQRIRWNVLWYSEWASFTGPMPTIGSSGVMGCAVRFKSDGHIETEKLWKPVSESMVPGVQLKISKIPHFHEA